MFGRIGPNLSDSIHIGRRENNCSISRRKLQKLQQPTSHSAHTRLNSQVVVGSHLQRRAEVAGRGRRCTGIDQLRPGLGRQRPKLVRRCGIGQFSPELTELVPELAGLVAPFWGIVPARGSTLVKPAPEISQVSRTWSILLWDSPISSGIGRSRPRIGRTVGSA